MVAAGERRGGHEFVNRTLRSSAASPPRHSAPSSPAGISSSAVGGRRLDDLRPPDRTHRAPARSQHLRNDRRGPGATGDDPAADLQRASRADHRRRQRRAVRHGPPDPHRQPQTASCAAGDVPLLHVAGCDISFDRCEIHHILPLGIGWADGSAQSDPAMLSASPRGARGRVAARPRRRPHPRRRPTRRPRVRPMSPPDIPVPTSSAESPPAAAPSRLSIRFGHGLRSSTPSAPNSPTIPPSTSPRPAAHPGRRAASRSGCSTSTAASSSRARPVAVTGSPTSTPTRTSWCTSSGMHTSISPAGVTDRVNDEPTRRAVCSDTALPSGPTTRNHFDALLATAPMVEVTFDIGTPTP